MQRTAASNGPRLRSFPTTSASLASPCTWRTFVLSLVTARRDRLVTLCPRVDKSLTTLLPTKPLPPKTSTRREKADGSPRSRGRSRRSRYVIYLPSGPTGQPSGQPSNRPTANLLYKQGGTCALDRTFNHFLCNNAATLETIGAYDDTQSPVSQPQCSDQVKE